MRDLLDVQEPRRGRPEAAAVIWSLRGPASKAEDSHSSTRLRVRGAVQALAGATIGGLVLGFGSKTFGLVILGIASLILLAALLSPTGLYAAVDRGFLALGRGIGQVLTWLALPLVFYLVFVPFGFFFRRGRRDAMKRFYEPSAPSYWSDRTEGVVASASRLRQF